MNMVSTGICLSGNVPLRAEPSEKSEMVSELLFGETFSITLSEHHWLYICGDMDKYAGWVPLDRIKAVPETYSSLQAALAQIVTVPFVECIMPDGTSACLPGGSILPEIPYNQSFKFAGETYHLQWPASGTNLQDTVSLAMQYSGTSYLWGGKSHSGIDCSGFVQVIFRMAGKRVSRDAWQQAQSGKELAFEEIEPGDLVFFGNDNLQITHVGIVCNSNTVIHASGKAGKVRVDRLDKNGIFNERENQYTHRLFSARRIEQSGFVNNSCK